MNEQESVYSKAIRAFNLQNQEESTKHLQKILSDVIERRKNKTFRNDNDKRKIPEYSKAFKKNNFLGNSKTQHNYTQDSNADFLNEMLNDIKCTKCRDVNFDQGNQLVECQSCTLVYHQKCQIPNIKSDETKSWRCLGCKTKNSKSKHSVGGLAMLADAATLRTHIKSDANNKNFLKNFPAKPKTATGETRFNFEAVKNHVSKNHVPRQSIDLSTSSPTPTEWHNFNSRNSPSWDAFSTNSDIKRAPFARSDSTTSTGPPPQPKKAKVKENPDWMSRDTNQSKKITIGDKLKKRRELKKKTGKTKK